jgi:hypothetical protein
MSAGRKWTKKRFFEEQQHQEVNNEDEVMNETNSRIIEVTRTNNLFFWETKKQLPAETRKSTSEPQLCFLVERPPQIDGQTEATRLSHYTIHTDGISPGGRLQRFYQQWTKMTNHRWPLQVINQGDQIQWIHKPRAWKTRELCLSKADQLEMDVAVRQLLEANIIEKSPSQSHQFLSQMLVVKEKDRIRPILNCRWDNLGLI